MKPIPESVGDFLRGKRIAVAGVSRSKGQAANAIFQRLRQTGHEVLPVNPNAAEVEGERCYPDLTSVPGALDGLVIATHPRFATALVKEAAARGIPRVWFHRSFGAGSVSEEAVKECQARGIEPIVGGCPLMYCGSVDPVHGCMRWWLRLRRRVPG